MCRFRRWSDVISPAAVDVAVLGAGVAGSAAALELLAQGCTVALLHRYDPVARFESLSIAASSALERYGIEPGTPIDTVHASWGSSEVRSARHPGARVAERQALAGMLRDLAASRGAVTTELGRLLDVIRTRGSWCLEWAQPHLSTKVRRLQARHLVDASGRRAVLARKVGARMLCIDDLAGASFITGPATVAGVWTESVEEGWWNLCGDRDGGTAAFYSSPWGIRRALVDLHAAFCSTELARRARVDAPRPVVRACGSQRLSICGGPGWIALGDAAWACQPLASAGIAKALRDATLVTRGLAEPGEYDDFQQGQFEAYFAELNRQYALESRWPLGDFWSGWSQRRTERRLSGNPGSISWSRL
jgi:flavin-dependent dehydrogenase